MSQAPRAPRRLGLADRAKYRRINAVDGMPPITHPRIEVEAGIEVPGGDGMPLLADHWRPVGLGPAPTVLIRSPYGRDLEVPAVALALAERGLHVIVQSCRGTFGSGAGEFEPFHHEAADGRAALAWVRAQSWSNGVVETGGDSYLGLTQWALIDGDHQPPDGLTVANSSRRFDRWAFLEGGGFNLETQLVWIVSLHVQERPAALKFLGYGTALARMKRAIGTAPAQGADRVLVGRSVPAYRDWVEHSAAGDLWWQPFAFAEQLDRIAPTTLLGGWRDLFLAGILDDYARLRDAGRPVRLVLGDWDHFGPMIHPLTVRAVLRRVGGLDGEDPPVNFQLAPTDEWIGTAAWPPPSTAREWALTLDGGLGPQPGSLGEVAYRYDPADPTPSAGGRSLNPFTTGRKRQRTREGRDDVVSFTTPPLAAPLECVGDIEAELALESSNPGFDVFLRICDVDTKGRSTGVVDAYQRGPQVEDGKVKLRFPGTAYRFEAGHRLRLQVSSGAHPLHLRNAGHDDPVRDLTRLVPSDQRLRVGVGSGSRIVVPELVRQPAQ